MAAWLITLARGTDRGLALVRSLLEELRQRRILAPALSVLDRLASAVRHRARREAYRSLTIDLTPEQRVRLDDLLTRAPTPGRRILGGSASPAECPIRATSSWPGRFGRRRAHQKSGVSSSFLPAEIRCPQKSGRNPVSVYHSCPKRCTDTGFPREKMNRHRITRCRPSRKMA